MAWETARERQAGPLRLTAEQRAAVEKQLVETCEDKGWALLAIRVEPEILHVVVAATAEQRMVMTELKGWATVRLRTDGLLPSSVKPWARNGQVRELWSEDEVEAARQEVAGTLGHASSE